MDEKILKVAADTVRVVAAQTISNAKSGHTGMAIGAAPALLATYLNMKVNPNAPAHFDRDRFVLSAGHGSALLYTTLHFMGFPISRDDLKTFRRLGGDLHGHPEVNKKLGIDCSTGPLGQGFAMAVGMAMAEKWLSNKYNRPDFTVVNHTTFCLAGDGCLQEGISYEAAALAGTWGLEKLVLVYDCNAVQLDGPTKNVNAEDTEKRFLAAGWRVINVENGNDIAQLMSAISTAKVPDGRPTIIISHSTIGLGTSAENSNKAHGQVLTVEEIANLRRKWGLAQGAFEVDKDVEEFFKSNKLRDKLDTEAYDEMLLKYKEKYPTEYAELRAFINGEVPKFDVVAEGKRMAMRDAGQVMLTQIAAQTPRLIGTNADISSSTKAIVKGAALWSSENQAGEMLACGVREFAMAAICNGLALCGFLPYCSTFLVFSDYLRAAIRLTALMDLPVTYIFSHDGLGTTPDGPTHQPTEHIAALRLIPNLNVYRPCCDAECAAVYKHVFEAQKPAVIIVSRGEVPAIDIGKDLDISRGGYLVKRAKNPRATVIATGSEVCLALDAAELLDFGVNVASIPCVELFAKQDAAFRNLVINPDIPAVAIELGTGDAWYKFADFVIDFSRFGASGDEAALREKIGFTKEQIAKKITRFVQG